MKKTELIKIDCPICGIDTPYDVKYEANFQLDSLDFAAKKISKHMYFRNVRCKKCNLIYSNPIIPFEQIKKFYQTTYFLELSQLEIMANDYEIFNGKSLSDLFKDIYDNTTRNKEQLEVLMKEVVGFIKDGDTAVQIIPMLKEYLEINVKNDDQLVKVAAIVQRLISVENKGGSEDEFGLSDAEKEQLMGAIEDVAADAQKHSDDITEVNKLEN